MNKIFGNYLTIVIYYCLIISSFGYIKNIKRTLDNNIRLSSPSSLSSSSSPVATLDKRTLWEIRLLLREEGSPNESATAIARVRFIESKNYEPPQENDLNGFIKVNDKGYTSNYKLSEDINDRKDGLWIWGLLKEPAYPFLYFFLNVYDTVFVGDDEEKLVYGKGIPGGKLSVRFDHSRDKKGNVLLSNGQVTYQQQEMMKVDPLGIGGQINGGDNIVAGIIEMTPVFK